ncbi:MAG: homoaconitate hydratase [Leptolinea sp.]|jgi:methanogen homoaconitase small subunit|nr:homoaconitate hydratase [Leptolinea sp.]
MARIWKFGADVDTDQIVPGRYAPYMRPDADVAEAAFIEARPDFAKNARPGDIIVALENFGCGSSREYAVEALRRRKVGAIIALSFARIFYRNAINLGIPLFEAPQVVTSVQDGDSVVFDFLAGKIGWQGQMFVLPPMPDFARQIISAGGVVEYVRQNGHFPGEQ